MASTKQGWSDQHVEQVVGNLLRVGVITAALTVLAGGVLYLIRYGRLPVDESLRPEYLALLASSPQAPFPANLAWASFYLSNRPFPEEGPDPQDPRWRPHSYRIFQGEPADLRSPVGMVKEAMGLGSRGLIQLGLLLLIATPVARVIFSVYAFARQKDMTYVVVTVIVLAILLYSLFNSHL